MLIKNKKAEQHELLFIIFQIILITAIAFTLMSYVTKLSKNTVYEKDYLTKDTALLIDTLFMPQGNIHYTYNINQNLRLTKSNFKFFFTNQEATIIEEIEGKPTTTRFLYAKDGRFQISAALAENPKKLEFGNYGYDFSIGDSVIENSKKVKYPYVEVKQPAAIYLASGILKDPATGKDYATPFVNEITPTKTTKRETKEIFSKAAVENRFEIVSQETADLIIILSSNSQNSKIFRIYIPSNPDVIKQSRKLASLIVNELVDKELTPLIVPIKSNIQAPTINLEIGDDILKVSAEEIQSAVSIAVGGYY